MLSGKNVVLGVTGCIAAYKACDIVSRLKKLGANIDVIMTKNALEFVTALSFETLSKNAVVTDTFARNTEFDVNHVSLAKKADVFVVAPATADVIGKFAHGIADDMLTTTYMANTAQKIICPAMNTNMYESTAVQDNLEILQQRGAVILEPAIGRLACGDIGKGKMVEPQLIVEEIERILQPKNDFKGKRVLVTAGATEESIDGVRYITNHSSGKMGCAIASAAAERGAEVVLIHGKMLVDVPKNTARAISATTTQEMLDAVKNNLHGIDTVIMAAAPSDYRVCSVFEQKIKSETLTLDFVKNPDIAAWVGKNKGNATLVVFSAETENLIENATAKMLRKNADMVVANDVTKEGAGFYVDTNIATIITRDGECYDSGLVEKTRLAEIILDKAAQLK